MQAEVTDALTQLRTWTEQRERTGIRVGRLATHGLTGTVEERRKRHHARKAEEGDQEPTLSSMRVSSIAKSWQCHH